MGLGTQLINLLLEPTFHGKIENSILNSISFLPFKEDIISSLKNSREFNGNCAMIRELLDLVLITTARTTQKLTLPLLFAKHIFEVMKSKKHLDCWSFCGAKMIAYTNMVASQITFAMKGKGTANEASQIFHHATYGTYLDDLSVLSQITNKAVWLTRKDFKEFFNKREDQPYIVFKAISYNYFSKLAQSLLMKGIGSNEPQSVGRPTFSGATKRTFTEAFRTYLQSGKAITSYSSSPNQLAFNIKQIKTEIMSTIGQHDVIGTTPWFKVEDGTLVPTELVVETSNKFFYS